MPLPWDDRQAVWGAFPGEEADTRLCHGDTLVAEVTVSQCHAAMPYKAMDIIVHVNDLDVRRHLADHCLGELFWKAKFSL